MEFKAASEDVARTCHPHPTRSEALRQAAMGVEGWTMQAQRAHGRNMSDLATRNHSTEVPTIRVIAMPADANPAGDIFGGWLMGQMDLAASTIATRRAHGRTATVAVDGMSFLAPVAVGDEVSLYAVLTGEGRSSMKIRVEAWRRPRAAEETEKVTEAVFTFVAIGEDRKARALPPSQARGGADAQSLGNRSASTAV